MNDDFDDYDFTPTSNSSLLTLFDNSSEVSDNSSLTYTAPKQPKQGSSIEKQNDVSKVESSIICARVVQVWKLVDAKYQGVGKLGFAIIGYSSEASYETILYRDRKNVIMRAKIHPNFEVTIKKDDFISFFDSVGDNWLVKFNNHEEAISTANTIEKYGGKITKLEVEKPSNTTNVVNVDNTTETRAKADILTRIAKMGQSILPSKTTDIEEETETVDAHIEPHNTVETLQNKQCVSLPSHIIQHPHPSHSLVMGHPYDPLSLYVAENRAQSTEVRLNLSDISEKLNHIMKLIDTEKSKTEVDPNISERKIKVLQLRCENLLKELNFVQGENVKLKQQMRQDDLLEYQKQIEELTLEKEQATKQIEDIEIKQNAYKSNIAELSKLVETQRSEIEELRITVTSHSSRDFELKNEILKLENTVSDLELKLKHSEQQNSSTRLSHEEIKEKNAKVTAMLKEEMNGMYANIVGDCTEDQHDSSKVDVIIIAQNIKSTTLKIIQNFQQIFGQSE